MIVSGGPEVFGQILTARDVEQRCMDRLKLWSPTYLAELERQTGRDPGSLPQVRAWTFANDFEKWVEDQLPGVLLLSTGLTDEPVKDGRSVWRATWAIGLAAIVSTSDLNNTSALARVYAAALRTALLQHPPEGCFGITWMGEQYDDINQIDTRSISAGQVIFNVTYNQVVSDYRGPLVPPDDPLEEAEEYTVETVETDVHKVPITEEVRQ